ncbi:ERF family protein [Staphylococcus gallinarum]|uniref:ERF family protein n=1 Tax=Staphylococcus gallinarum TaxID=1293 RepID=UPI000D1D745A|nr:ERF family protein [Staphylococcus gallinarum]PTK92527.1 single-stranded DNA-binding protein [Staphylococcus gallinarum]PTK93444.1 single-stranded DNA-binding protein [Staphylococcus gallinarum]RIO87107.1 single-stranded DNA-binding protein [Staphylococcus gallinarum]
MNKSESIVEINKALVEFHKKVKQPMKDANNPFFKSKYVPLENVVEAIDDVAPSLGLSFTQWASNDANGRVGVSTMVLHESGEFIEFDPVFMKADKETAQGAGALISYLKRYSLSAVFGITSDQDDDGNYASGVNGKPKATQAKTNSPTKTQKDELRKAIETFIGVVVENGRSEEYKETITRLQNAQIDELTVREIAQTHNVINKYLKEIEQ